MGWDRGCKQTERNGVHRYFRVGLLLLSLSSVALEGVDQLLVSGRAG